MLAKSRWMLGQIPAWVLQTGAARRCRRYGRMRSAGGQCAGASPVGPVASPTRSAGPGGVLRPRRRGRRLQLQPWRPAGTASAGDVTAFAVASTCKVGATRWWTVGQANGWDKAAVQELRGAVYRGDGQAVLAALRERPLESVLQLAGDGLLVALRQQTGGARELAGACLDALRERMAEGDEELAEELAAALAGAVLMRRPVPVDLDEMSRPGRSGRPRRRVSTAAKVSGLARTSQLTSRIPTAGCGSTASARGPPTGTWLTSP